MEENTSSEELELLENVEGTTPETDDDFETTTTEVITTTKDPMSRPICRCVSRKDPICPATEICNPFGTCVCCDCNGCEECRNPKIIQNPPKISCNSINGKCRPWKILSFDRDN